MKNNYISINTDTIESLASELGNISNDVIEGHDSTVADTKNVKDSGLMQKSSTKVLNQMLEISNILNIGKRMILKSAEKMCETENRLNEIAQKIDVPRDFIINDVARSKTLDSTILEKQDGKSVINENTSVVDLEFNSSIDYNKKLNSLIKDYEIKNGVLEFNYNNSISLGNINNSNDVHQIDSNDSTILENVNLKKIDNPYVINPVEEISINDLEV